MSRLLTIAFLLLAGTVLGQSTFGFEALSKDQPFKWYTIGQGDYFEKVDSTVAHSGKNSLLVFQEGEKVNFGGWAYNIPANFAGERIKLTGYVKTENVEDGFAGLWMRIDPKIAFDNMNDRGVKGTTDWQQYEIELDLNANHAQRIVIGALLVGKGKAWVDDLEVTIDGRPLSEAEPKEVLPADRDSAFLDGSEIVLDDLDGDTEADLVKLGKVWGLLKYHHPAIAKGEYNWDSELFRFLPDYLKATNAQAREISLLTWIGKLGEVPECTDCPPVPEEAFLQPDNDWIEQEIKSPELRNALQYIITNPSSAPHYYVSLVPGVKNPVFTHENDYAQFTTPDDGYRLLALYRYWNIIHYFFPYRHQIDKDWHDVLDEYLPVFLASENRLDYEQATVRLIGEVHDTHANLWGGKEAFEEWKGKYYPPVFTRFIEDKLVVTDFFNAEHRDSVKLEVGDIITSIEGRSVAELIEERRSLYPASNEPTRLRDISHDLLRNSKESITVTYQKGGEEKQAILPLYPRQQLNYYRWYRREPQKSYRFLTEDIGYASLQHIEQEDIEKLIDTFHQTKGLVIDIRNYPKTFVPFALGGYFVEKPTEFVKFTSGDPVRPGTFTFGSPLSIKPLKKTYQGQVVVLTNELSQSQAEYTAMGFRAGANTTIMGSTTAGADGNVSPIPLPGGMRTMISGIGVFYPDGTETQRIGIVPDIKVEPTIEGIRAGKDEVLDRAIQFIQEGK